MPLRKIYGTAFYTAGCELFNLPVQWQSIPHKLSREMNRTAQNQITRFKKSYAFGVIDLSRISFVTFCIEFYSKHIQKPSNEVYLLFKKEGILDLLEREYEDLHGMSMEYLMHFIDELIGNSF
jgi:hypothetical protein